MLAPLALVVVGAVEDVGKERPAVGKGIEQEQCAPIHRERGEVAALRMVNVQYREVSGPVESVREASSVEPTSPTSPMLFVP